MKILHKYIVTEFLKLFAITTMAFISIFMLVDFIDRISEMIERNVPFSESLGYFFYKIPSVFSMVSPIAVLLSVVLSLGILTRRSEVTAIKAGGAGILRVIMPLLICGALLSVASIFVNEIITPITNKRAFNIELKWLHKKPKGMFNREGLWVRSSDGIYNIMKLDLKNKTIRGVTLYKTSKDFKATGRIKANSATWENNIWVAANASEFVFTEKGSIEKAHSGQIDLPLNMSPDDFSSLETSHENMNFLELRRYISTLRQEGYNTTRYIVDMYGKLTFPMVNFLMILIGIPFALKEGRRNSIADGVAMSIAIGFSFWVIFEVARSLGHSGVIPPIVAASFTNVLFLAIGVYLFGYIRQ
ncbi:MAG: LPS export ABC transporter permease LptG [Thermodesulfobacteriota bacterium]